MTWFASARAFCSCLFSFLSLSFSSRIDKSSFLHFKHNLAWQAKSSLQSPLCSYIQYVWSFSKAFETDVSNSLVSFVLSSLKTSALCSGTACRTPALSLGRTSSILNFPLLVWVCVVSLLIVWGFMNISLCTSTLVKDSRILETSSLWVSSVSYPFSHSSGCKWSPKGLPNTKWLLHTFVFSVTWKLLRLIIRSHTLKCFWFGLCHFIQCIWGFTTHLQIIRISISHHKLLV